MMRISNYMVRPGIDNYKMSIEAALTIMSETYGIPKEVLLSQKRDRYIVELRQLLFYVLRKKFNYSCNAIAIYFNKDHATVSYATKVVEEMASVDQSFRNKLNNVKYIL